MLYVAFCVATLPVVRWCTAALQASFRFWAMSQAAQLARDVSVCRAPHLLAGSSTVSDISSTNLCTEQVSALQVEGNLLW